MTAVPYKESNLSKKGQVEQMFDHISPKYDLLNHLLSANIDKVWRRKSIGLLKAIQPQSILDVATGTADFAIEAAKLNPQKITGIDLSEGMLQVGRQKVKSKNLDHIIELIKADSESLPFDNDVFDASIVGFGVRNFENLKLGLAEIYRVIKPRGTFIVLEFSRPKNKIFGSLYFFYFKKVLPLLGRIISKNSSAYTYLPESVQQFPDGEAFLEILRETGFKKCISKSLTGGIATIYKAEK